MAECRGERVFTVYCGNANLLMLSRLMALLYKPKTVRWDFTVLYGGATPCRYLLCPRSRSWLITNTLHGYLPTEIDEKESKSKIKEH